MTYFPFSRRPSLTLQQFHDVLLGQAFMEFIRQQILQHLRPYYVYVGTFWFWYFGCRSRASSHTCPKSFLYYGTISTFINLFNQLDTYTPSGLTNGSVSSCGRVTIEHILPLFWDHSGNILCYWYLWFMYTFINNNSRRTKHSVLIDLALVKGMAGIMVVPTGEIFITPPANRRVPAMTYFPFSRRPSLT